MEELVVRHDHFCQCRELFHLQFMWHYALETFSQLEWYIFDPFIILLPTEHLFVLLILLLSFWLTFKWVCILHSKTFILQCCFLKVIGWFSLLFPQVSPVFNLFLFHLFSVSNEVFKEDRKKFWFEHLSTMNWLCKCVGYIKY